ncbi:hypothetical protein LMG29739_00060 [Paraburkholderia solisilvae]|uniref:HTH gntR-type domain-containing protein n=1 Tax=Paraburkholderia solisilvae TaxID=624376 RepID=A0A6J5CY81_9BURK|nr:hypothetical protein LMG29739_00060 [Paraburkholderia solisilvae]
MVGRIKTPTRVELSVAAIRGRAESAPGVKLPSIRRLAELQRVSNNSAGLAQRAVEHKLVLAAADVFSVSHGEPLYAL